MVFVGAFALLTVTFPLYAVSEFYVASGRTAEAEWFMVAAGAVGFSVCAIGWYLMLVLMVFDLAALLRMSI